MDDWISREAVLPIIAGIARTQDEYDESYDKLMQIPSLEIEPSSCGTRGAEVRHGRWITKDSKTAKCSCCGWWQHAKMYYLPDDISGFTKCYRFCTACGVQMDGGADDAAD